MAEGIVRDTLPTLQPALEGLKRDQYLIQAKAKPATCVDLFVNYFLELSQGPTHRQLCV